MGARAHKALRALTPHVATATLSDKDKGGDVGDDDDDNGGPGPLEDGGDLPGGNQGELSVAVDDSGQHIVVGFNDSRGFRKNPVSVSGFMYSDDGGKTFVDGGQLPAPVTGAVGATLLPQVFGDPDVKYLGDCTFIYASILFAPFGASAAQTLGFHRSFDCGHTWEGPFEIPAATNPNGVVSATGAPADAADKEFIDVDRASGRVMTSWTNFSFAVEMSTTFSDNVLGAQPTWSQRVIVGARDVDGQSSVPRFGPPGSNLVYVVWRTFFDSGFGGESVARSTDNGVTFEAPVDLSPGFFPPDQILGNDRNNFSPGMAVDRSRGRHRGTVYVTYGQNDSQDGADIVVQTSTDNGKTFGAPVFVNARPGADRSQWFPWITVNDRTGRALLFYYDQGIADSGDLMQSSFTFSDDGGRTFAQQRRLPPQPFHGGWGNDTGQPNLGDYIQSVVDRSGRLVAAYAITHAPGFTDGQPVSASMTVPEPIVSIVGAGEQTAITSLDFQGATATELRGASNRNGFLDAGETALVNLSVRNYITNPQNARSVRGAFAVVTSSTPGVRVPLGVTLFPTLEPGATKGSLFPLIVSLDKSFVSGQDVTLAIKVFSVNGLPASLEATLHTGTPVDTVLVSENFDAVAPGTLPAGWTAAHGAGGNTVPWTTSASFCGSTSNGAFHVNANDAPNPANQARWERLFGPIVTVPTDSNFVDLEFDICTDTEDDPSFNVQAFDGFFVRVFDATPGNVGRSVLAEAFEQDMTTDGFAGYPKHLPRSNNAAYFPDMSVWAGDSGGIKHVKMRLPGMAGTSAQLRFEFTQDAGGTCADVRPGHSCGVFIDNVVMKSVAAKH